VRLGAVAPLLLVAVVLGLSAAGAAETDPWIGKWKSVDLDGSNQTLTISRRADGAYDVIVFDDRAGICGGIAASGVGVGTVAGNTMTGTTTITCANGKAAGTFPLEGTYDPKTDTFTDGLGVVWSRVRAPAPQKATPLPLGRLVLNAREAPGLQTRPASPALATQALARALRRKGLPRFSAEAVKASHFARGKGELWSIAFVTKSPAAASRAASAIARVGRGARVRLGARGFVMAPRGAGRRPVLVVWARGRVLGAIEFAAPFRPTGLRAVAIGYAELADSLIARAVSKTAWQHVLDRIGPNGRITRSIALDLFALAYGPLPGTRRPPGPAGRIDDGTPAMRGILRYWRTLNPAQRAVAARLLGITGVPNASTRSLARASRPRGPLVSAIVGDPLFTEDDALLAIAEKYATIYKQRLGEPLNLQLVVGRTAEPIKTADASPVDDFGFEGTPFAKYCRIRLGPNFKTMTGMALEFTMAHEVFHCMQFSIVKPTFWNKAESDWLWEGSADWAALRVTQAPWGLAPSPQNYLNSCAEKSLFARTYDGVGFVAHSNDAGIGTFWSRAAAALKATLVGDEAAYDASGGSTDAVLSTWASSPLVVPKFGISWVMYSPIVPPLGAGCPTYELIGDTQVSSKPLASALHTIEPGVVYVDRPLMHVLITAGRARISDAKWIDKNVVDDWFCLQGECKCPEGTEGFPPPALRISRPAVLGLTGGKEAGHGTVKFVSLDEYCKEKQLPPKKKKEPGKDPVPVPDHPGPDEDPPDAVQCTGNGCGHSAADPHLLPFGGGWYDFQAAGEFTLVRSVTGDFEVQVRQEPYPGSKVVSINTAAAMRVAGDRVAVYRGLPLTVRVNGQPVRLGKKDVKLPRGGTLRPLRQGQIDVIWPEGTVVRIIPPTDVAIDIIVSLATSRLGKVRGLLGDNDGNTADDVETRSGSRLDPEGIRGTDKRAYNLLYRVFGDSWRVTPKGSLFDYAPGQSTRTYTNRRFPARIATTKELTPELRRKAEKVCRRMGFTSKRVLDACILDVAQTGNFGFATALALSELGAKKTKKKAPPPPPPAKKPGATVVWAGKTYTYRPASSQDGCEKAGKDIKFSAQFTASPGRKLAYGFKLFVLKGTKDGTYTTGVGTIFEIEDQILIAIEQLKVTLAGSRTRGTFSGTASTAAKEPVSGSFRC